MLVAWGSRSHGQAAVAKPAEVTIAGGKRQPAAETRKQEEVKLHLTVCARPFPHS
jgi:hypothetical protein